MCGASWRSVEGLHVLWVYSCRGRLAIVASIFIHLHVLFGHDQAPSKLSHPATSERKSSGFRHCASLLRRWIVHSPFVYFLQIFAVSTNFRSFRPEIVSRRATTQQAVSKLPVPRKPMKAHAILSVLVVLAAAKSTTEDGFQRRRSTRLTLSTHAAHSIFMARCSKALELSGQ